MTQHKLTDQDGKELEIKIYRLQVVAIVSTIIAAALVLFLLGKYMVNRCFARTVSYERNPIMRGKFITLK